VANQDRKIALCPSSLSVKASCGEPPQLIGDGAGCVVVRVKWGHDGGGVYEIAEDDPSAWREAVSDPPEELGLSSVVEVVDGERRDDDVERRRPRPWAVLLSEWDIRPGASTSGGSAGEPVSIVGTSCAR
jgi:hypothetical protein